MRANPVVPQTATGPVGQACGILLVLLVLLALLWSRLIHAHDHADFAFLVDADRSLSANDMARQDFRPVHSTFGGGLEDTAIWLRVTFGATDPAPVLLRFLPGTTKRIILYSPIGDGGWRVSQTGTTAIATADVHSRFGWTGFVIDPKAGGRPYYAQIEKNTPGAVLVDALPVGDETRFHLRDAAASAMALSVTVFAIVLVAHRFTPLTSLPHFSYLALLISNALYLLGFEGYLVPAIGIDGQLAEAVHFNVGLASMISLLGFHLLFLRDYGPPRFLVRILQGLFIASIAAALLYAADAKRVATIVAVGSHTLGLVVLFAMVLCLRADGAIPRAQVRLVYLGYLGGLALNVALRTGLVESELLFRNSFEIVALLSSTLILALMWLQNRAAAEEDLGREVALAGLSADLKIAQSYSDLRFGLMREIDTLSQQLAQETEAAIAANSFALDGPKAARSASALRAVIERCLFAHTAATGAWNVTRTVFSPARLLREIALGLAPAARWKLDLGLFMVESDPGLVDLALRNVLANALRYCDEGRVEVRLQQMMRGGESGALVTLTNLSALAEPFDSDRVFDKFYRGASSAGRGGTGLGLYITREVVTALSGEVTLQSRPEGAGSVVMTQIWIPDR